MEQTKKRIAVHDQTFHADDCLSVYFLHNTKEFENAEVIRTRDPEVLATCDAVCDTGGVYDHEKRRYDHHQPSFNEKFPGSDIPLASCGTCYLHFGKEIVTNILARYGRDIGEYVDFIYESMYHGFLKEVDANDNGISQYGPDVEPLYFTHTGISARVAMLNTDGTFEEAVQLIGTEFEQMLLRTFDSTIPAIAVTKSSFEKRTEVDPSGKIVVMDESCGFERHLKHLEEETGCEPILFVVSERSDGAWQIKAMSTGRGFELRKPLPFAGLRDQELSDACGIPGGVFVHRNAFLGGFKTKEAAIAFAKLALE